MITTKNRRIAAKLLGLATSDNDREALSAFRAAARIVKDNNMSWYDMLSVTEKGDDGRKPHSDLIKRALADDPGVLTAWEKGFLSNLAAWDKSLSAKQNEVLQRLVNKVNEALEVEGKQ